jgi:hypothetical protein
VAVKRAAHIPVIMPPMGKIRICVPGTKNCGVSVGNGALVDAAAVVLVASEKTPLTKVASLDARVVLTTVPDEVDAERVTTGMRRPSRVAL